LISDNRYHRSFIILSALDGGYGIDERKEPAGYCKMEIRKNQGKILLYVQDLNPAQPQQTIYDVVMISAKDGIEPIKLTSIQIPDHGRGEYEITFDPENVHESGAAIDQFHALALVHRFLSGEEGLRFPLVGYSDKRVQMDWAGDVANKLKGIYNKKRSASNSDTSRDIRNQSVGIMSFSEETSPKDEADELEDSVPGRTADTLQEAEELDREERAEDAIDHEAVIDKQDTTYQAEESRDQVLVDGMDTDGINPELLKFEPPDISYIYEGLEKDRLIKADYGSTPDGGNKEAELHTSPNHLHQLDETYWDKVKGYFNRLFEDHKKVVPFDDPAGEVDWIRVENQSEPLYPSYWANDFYGGRAAYLDHYLVGLVRKLGKVEYLVYGIPGVYSIIPPMNMYGFSRWLPVKNGYGAGYWLLYIDAISGNIAYPY